MPAARRNESNAMLYALIAFIAVSIIATIFAVVYYVKHEEQKTAAIQAKAELSELATTRQWRDRAKIVGTTTRRQTYLGNAVDYVHRLAAVVSGGPVPEDVSAQDMVSQSFAKVKETINKLVWADIQIDSFDANSTGLTTVLNRLNEKCHTWADNVLDLSRKLNELNKQFAASQQSSYAKEQELSDEVAKYHNQVNSIRQDYNDLQALLKKTTGEQVHDLSARLQQAKELQQRTSNALMKTQAELHATQGKLQKAETQVQKIIAPEMDAAAFEPDGRVILVNNQIVHINIGIDDKVYPGLTFAVYDKSEPVPENGRGKAEIKVFDVQKNVSAAKVLNIQPETGIVVDDIVANLIWDSSKQSIFVIAGDFDLNKDGEADFDAIDRLKKLIDKWGGETADKVSIDTDFVVLGRAPRILREPSPEELELDPMATQKYEAAKQRRDRYDQVKNEAKTLWVPVFSIDRFFYFIGYKTLAGEPNAL